MISVAPKRVLQTGQDTFMGYTSKDLLDLLIAVHEAEVTDHSEMPINSMELRLESFIKELHSCLQVNRKSLLNLFNDEIVRLLKDSDTVDMIPRIKNGIHVPNWIVVLFVPFNRVPLYINIPSTKYKAIVSWRLKRGK